MIEIKGRRIQLTNQTPPEPPTDLDAVLANIFEHRSRGQDSFNSTNNPAAHLDEVYTIGDVIGGRTMSYSGNPTPNATKKRPVLFKQAGIIPGKTLDMVYMENEFNIQYDSIIRVKPALRSMGKIWIMPDYTRFEAFDNSISREYFGELGLSVSGTKLVIRFTNSNNITLEVDFKPNAICYILLKCVEDGLNSDPSMISLKVYYNGVLQNPTKHVETYRRGGSTEGFGTDSNCALHGLIDTFKVYRDISDTEITNAWNAINNYYKIGQEVKLPIAKSIDIVRSGTTVTANYTYYNPLGYPEDVSGRLIQWWSSNAGIQDGEFITALDNQKSFNISAYPNKFNASIRVNIRVKDTMGNIFWLPQAFYKENIKQ